MAKTPKSERRALAALADVADAGKRARKAAKKVGDKLGRMLRKRAAEADSVAGVPRKKVRKHPKKIAAKANDTAERVTRATEEALEKQERKAQKRRQSPQEAEQRPDISTVMPEPARVEPTVSEAPDVETPSDQPAPDAARDLSTWTVAQLRARARLEGRSGYSRMTKAQLLELLR